MGHIAVKEAQKLNIPIFAMVDTNSDPRDVDYAVPSNDDAGKSIEIIMESVTQAVAEGLEERKSEKTGGKDKEEAKAAKKEEKKAEAAPKKEEKAAEEKSAKKAEAAPKKEEKAAEEKPAKKEAKAKSDDLTKIEGIGPKAAEALVANGMKTYAELADADAEKVKEILSEASSTLAHLDPTSWPKQAKMAADGKWDELKNGKTV